MLMILNIFQMWYSFLCVAKKRREKKEMCFLFLLLGNVIYVFFMGLNFHLNHDSVKM